MHPQTVQPPFDVACAWQQALRDLDDGAQRALASERPETATGFLGALAHLADTMQLYLHARQTTQFTWQVVPVTPRSGPAPHPRPLPSRLLPMPEHRPDPSGSGLC